MHDEELELLIKERMNKLPELVQGAINSLEWQEVVRNIVEKNHLRIDQGEAIETEVFLAMLGITNPKDFTKHLIENGRIEQDLAEKITSEIEERIFRAIRSIIELEIEKRDHPEEFVEEKSDEKKQPVENTKRLPTVEEMLQEIEDNPSPKEEHHQEIPDFIIGNVGKEKEIPQKSPEVKVVPDKKEVDTTPANLPTGDINDVPRHGHNHPRSSDTSPEPEAKVIPKPKEISEKDDDADLITKNLSGVSSIPKEDVDFSVRKIDKALEESVNKPKVDPYRESV